MTESDNKTLYHNILNCMVLHNFAYKEKPMTVTMSEKTKKALFEEIKVEKYLTAIVGNKPDTVLGMEIIINDNLINGTFVVGGIVHDMEGGQE